ncbi:hypothetical protein [Paenibacillus sp. sgz500958]|uniref:hypothetical protein n=1 Tax=Paenibacillus sp. sgz500958 TaxID=3242475 RepID=UPI0036D2419F
MSNFLDARSSVNSNIVGFPQTPLSPSPEIFGIIGLQTQNLANPIVLLQVSVGVLGEEGDVFTIDIVRGPTFSQANVIHSVDLEVTKTGFNQVNSITAADILAPAAPETIYTSYISGVSTTIRNGPEALTGMASK